MDSLGKSCRGSHKVQPTKPTTVPTSHEIQDTNLNTLSGLG